MKAEDLSAKEVFSLQGEWGLPLFAASRTMIMGTRSLGLLQADLVEMMGKERAGLMLEKHGYEAGLSTATAMADLYDWDSVEEWMKAGSYLVTIVGLAHVDLTDFQIDREKKTLLIKGVWRDSLEASQWLRQNGLSSTNVCHIMAGLAGGYASAVLGEEVLVKELSCRAQGRKVCRFEGRAIKEWGLEPGSRSSLKTGYSIDEDVALLRSQLQEAWEEVERQREEIHRLQVDRSSSPDEDGVVYRSEAMAQVLSLADKVAPTSATVLIVGESGTGKEILARYIHRYSGRAEQPFRAVNCAALPPNLLESELFGHVKGAFTGADRDKKGLFVEAGKGTILLDEIGDLPLELQAKLLRAIQEKEARPVGGVRDIPVEARIIAATNSDLKDMVRSGAFREDLYYRLAVIPIVIPPLRDRKQDILALSRYFLDRLRPDHPGFTPEALRLISSHQWPGNVRELMNAVEYATVLSPSYLILPEHLPAGISGNSGGPSTLITDFPTQEEMIQRYTKHVLNHTNGNKSEAVRILGIDYSTLWRRLKVMNIKES